MSLGLANFQSRPYVYTATSADLRRWSGAVDMGIGPNYIDTCSRHATAVFARE